MELVLEGINTFFVDGGSYTTPMSISSGSHVKISGTGTLQAVHGGSSSSSAGINISGATLEINSGTIEATGKRYHSGISFYDNPTLIINGGAITATGGSSGEPGIGVRSNMTSDGIITINGGTVKANSNNNDVPSIGLGKNASGNLKITVNGGIVETPQGISPKATLGTPQVTVKETTASSIAITPLDNATTYGGAQYKLDDGEWQDSNEFTGLPSAGHGGNNYTVYARYKGNENYVQSEAGTLSGVSTNSADYTISIPAKTLTAGNSESVGTIAPSKAFDLGVNGKVEVKVGENITEGGLLTLKKQDGNDTLTSALFVDGQHFTDISEPIAVFTMEDKGKTEKKISFDTPKNSDGKAFIPAGTYSGTMNFILSYTEGGQPE